MSTFTEINAVENLIRDRLSRGDVGWSFVPGRELNRGLDSILVEGALRDALIRLNPEIAADRNAPTRCCIGCARSWSQSERMAWCGRTRSSVPGWSASARCRSGKTT